MLLGIIAVYEIWSLVMNSDPLMHEFNQEQIWKLISVQRWTVKGQTEDFQSEKFRKKKNLELLIDRYKSIQK